MRNDQNTVRCFVGSVKESRYTGAVRCPQRGITSGRRSGEATGDKTIGGGGGVAGTDESTGQGGGCPGPCESQFAHAGAL